MNRLVVGFLIVGIVLGFVLVVAQEGEETILDLGNLLGIGGNITASGIDYSIEETSQRKDTTIDFVGENSFLEIEGNKFENIQPSSEEKNAFVKLDESGNIIGADFFTNEKGGTYNFLGEEIFVPANSRVLFDDKNGLIVEAAEGSEFREEDSLFDLKLIGENIKLPNGKILNSGELNYDSLGYAHLEEGKDVFIDGVGISANKNLDVYFDGERHSGNYVSLGEEFYFGGSEPAEVVFEGKNKYFKNMGEDDLVKFGLGEEDSEIRVLPVDSKGFSNVYCDNEYSVETGNLNFISDGNRVYYLENDLGENSVRMDVYTTTGEYNKLISVGDDSNFYAYVYEGGLSPQLYSFYSEDLASNLEATGNVFDDGLWNSYEYQANYVRGANQILKETFAKKYPELDISTFENAEDNFVLDSLAEDVPDYYVLTIEDVKDALEGTEYENYYQIKDSYNSLPGVVVPTSGTKEKLGEGAVGIRTIFNKLPQI